MDMVPIRDLFEQHREDVISRLERIERKLDEPMDHTHGDKVSWAALAGILVPLVGFVILVVNG